MNLHGQREPSNWRRSLMLGVMALMISPTLSAAPNSGNLESTSEVSTAAELLRRNPPRYEDEKRRRNEREGRQAERDRERERRERVERDRERERLERERAERERERQRRQRERLERERERQERERLERERARRERERLERERRERDRLERERRRERLERERRERERRERERRRRERERDPVPWPEPDPDPYPYPEPEPEPTPEPPSAQPQPGKAFQWEDWAQADIYPGDHEEAECPRDTWATACGTVAFWWSKPHRRVIWAVADDSSVQASVLRLKAVNTEGRRGSNGVLGITNVYVQYANGYMQNLVREAHENPNFTDHIARNDQLFLRDEEDEILLPLLPGEDIVNIYVEGDSWIAPDEEAFLELQLDPSDFSLQPLN